MVDITQLLPTDIYQAAVDPSGLRTVANAANPFATLADVTGGGGSTYETLLFTGSFSSINLADSTTYYFGTLPSLPPTNKCNAL
jgi:hypothetical protein